MSLLKRKYYLSEIAKLHRGNSYGRFVNAKPFFLLALIEAISDNILKENRIYFPNEELEKIYVNICEEYEPKIKPTPIILPLVHLRTESFYDIKWKGRPFVSSPKAHSPSGKYLRENFDYSFIDPELWNLLQDNSFRIDFRNFVINMFLPTK